MGKVVIPGFRKIETSSIGEGGTTNYNDLTNKPSINNVPLVGNLRTVDLKLTDATLTEEGVPAEAKTVGAKLEEQSTSLIAVNEELTKKANISDIPTKVSELQNDSNYQTDTDVTTTLTNYATKTYVGEQISSVDHLKREIVTEIPSPETADKNTIYMLKIESATGEDKYKEYLLIDGTLQCIGDTSVDLTDYAKKTEIPTELPANGGNSLTVNGHTVKSDVPENAVFTDTVYDDTEVKESIEELNSNLDGLGYGENQGGSNIAWISKERVISDTGVQVTYFDGGVSINQNKTYSNLQIKVPCKRNTKYNYGLKGYSDGNLRQFSIGSGIGYSWGNIIERYAFTDSETLYSGSFSTGDYDFLTVTLYASSTIASGSMTIKNFYISETDMSYEPYIPSVKMIAEEVSAQNESLADYGMDNKCSNLVNGYYNADDGSLVTNYNPLRYICSTNSYYLKKGETIRVNCNSVLGIYLAIYDTNGSFINRYYYEKKDVTYIAQDNIIIKWCVYFSTDTPISQSPHIGVYVNNSIDELKNDLDRIEGISTTEQIVGTFLGKNLYRNTVVLNFSTPFTVASGNNDTCIDSSGGMVSQASSYEGNIPWSSIDTLVNAESFVETSSYRFTNPFIFKKDKTGYWYFRNMYGETIAVTKVILTLYYTKYN